MELNNEIQNLISKIKGLEVGCVDQFLDLKSLKFGIKENEMRLYNDFHNYYFKSDPKNPRDPKVIHAIKQFTSLQEVPYSFFSKNPEYMKLNMVNCWLPSLSAEKSSVLGKLRTVKDSKDDFIIRALLPVGYTNITNSEVVEAVSREIQDDFHIDFVFGDERDDPVLHIRFISNGEFEVCGEKCSVGFSLVCSELGASPLSVDVLLYRCQSKGSLIATYGGESYFSFKYTGIQRNDLKMLFSVLVSHLREKTMDVKEKIQAAKELVQEKEDLQNLLQSLLLVKGLGKKFHTMLFQEIEEDKTVQTKWDFVNKMAVIAKGFDVSRRLKIEKAAGMLVDLVFSKD